jgi:hypothetical protein
MTIYEYLKNDKETIPTWLLEIKEGDKFPREDFFKSRIVFYPGSYTDGHAVKVFGSTCLPRIKRSIEKMDNAY